MTRDDHFSLSSVLKFRKSAEEEAAREVAHIKKRLENEKGLLMEMEASKESAVTRYREKKGLTVEEINIFHSFISTLDAEIIRQKKRVSDLVRECESKREELISAAMDKKIMETMRDREWEDYKRVMRLLDQKNMDEIAVNGYGRRI
jgi:flagellar FliJ protein